MGPPLPPKPVYRTLGDPSSPVAVDVFLDYTCPFSAKAFLAIQNSIEPALAGKARFLFYHRIQPWHPTSTLVHEAAMAVYTASGDSLDAFFKYSAVLFEEQKAFFDIPALDKTRDQLYTELMALAAPIISAEQLAVADSLLRIKRPSEAAQDDSVPAALNAGNGVTQQVKWAEKVARNRSVHVTPTYFVNGVEDPSASSSWGPAEWTERLSPLLQ